jgi:hypothetical protein
MVTSFRVAFRSLTTQHYVAAGRCQTNSVNNSEPLAAGRWPLAAGRWPLAAGLSREFDGITIEFNGFAVCVDKPASTLLVD